MVIKPTEKGISHWKVRSFVVHQEEGEEKKKQEIVLQSGEFDRQISKKE